MKDLILSKLQQEIFEKRYAMPHETTWSECAHRVANTVSSIEDKNQGEDFAELFYKALVTGDFISGGRVLFGAGRRQFNMLNCYRLHCEDTVESIGKMIQDTYLISCGGGGVGYNFSDIRPRGDDIQNIKNSAPGAVSIMKMVNEIGNHVRSGKNRRTALLAILNVDHPDLLEFLHVKLDLNQLNNFNISVGITNAFIDAVKKNKEWIFKFNGRTYQVYEITRLSNRKRDTIQVVALNEDDALGRAMNYFRLTQDDKFKDIKHVPVRAREIWDILIENAWKSGDPGIYNLDMANSFTNVSYFENLDASNPCLTGDTLVAVANGGKDKTIRELAQSGKDIPVYCLNDNNKVTIRHMRHPRKTMINAPIYKVTLDNGEFIRVTSNHKFILKDGSYKIASELSYGDSLFVMKKYSASLKDIFPQCNSSSQDYVWINSGFKSNKSEHRMIYEFYNGKIPKGHVIHHADYSAQNNHIDNLRCMLRQDHDTLHGADMVGDNNPMRRAQTEWSSEKWIQYRKNMSDAVMREKNGRYSGYSNDEIRQHAIKLTKILNKRFSTKEWTEYAKIHGLPISWQGEWRCCHLNGSVLGLSKWAALQCSVDLIDIDPRVAKTYRNLINQGYDCIIKNGVTHVIKYCEDCNKKMEIYHGYREVSICQSCAAKRALRSPVLYENRMKSLVVRREKIQEQQIKIFSDLKFSLNRDPWKKEWEEGCRLHNISIENGRSGSPFKSWKELKEAGKGYNHKVISVTIDGYEDVYNGTVDKFHNFFVGGWEENQKNGKPKYTYINNLQCGEINLPQWGNCCLGHVNLSNMYDDKKNDVNWKRFARAIRVGVRFLDDALAINHYPIPECRTTGERSRRIGLGVTGLHYLLLKLGYVYGDEKCLEFLDRLFATFRNEAYRASIELAKEKGSFPAFDIDRYSEEDFFKQLPTRIQNAIKKYGIRNAVMLTIAPCGSTSMILGVSSGVEPIFAPVYKRRFRDGNILREEYIVDSLFAEYYATGKDMKHFRGAYDITVEQHVAVQSTVQKYIDSAISKTINLPNDFSTDGLSDMMLEYAPYLKGCTIYRAGSKGDEPLEPILIKGDEHLKEIMGKAGIGVASIESCKDGKCDI